MTWLSDDSHNGKRKNCREIKLFLFDIKTKEKPEKKCKFYSYYYDRNKLRTMKVIMKVKPGKLFVVLKYRLLFYKHCL